MDAPSFCVSLWEYLRIKCYWQESVIEAVLKMSDSLIRYLWHKQQVHITELCRIFTVAMTTSQQAHDSLFKLIVISVSIQLHVVNLKSMSTFSVLQCKDTQFYFFYNRADKRYRYLCGLIFLFLISWWILLLGMLSKISDYHMVSMNRNTRDLRWAAASEYAKGKPIRKQLKFPAPPLHCLRRGNKRIHGAQSINQHHSVPNFSPPSPRMSTASTSPQMGRCHTSHCEKHIGHITNTVEAENSS